MKRAACTGLDPAIFYPEDDDKDGRDQALAICHGCPIEAECLEARLGEKWGIVGGTTANERKRMREGPRERDCRHCGKRFVSTRGRWMCSIECRKAAAAARNAAAKKTAAA